MRSDSGDPRVIGTCAACGHPIFSHETYYECYGDKIHARGVGAIAKTVETGKTIYMSCLLLYVQQDNMVDEVAQLLGIERRRNETV